MENSCVVIPNHYPELFARIWASIQAHETFHKAADCFLPVILVADRHRRIYPMVQTFTVSTRFSFARNANIGLRAFPDRDVFLVNDDIVLIEDNTFSSLIEIARKDLQIGILSPLIKGCVGNPVQRYWLKNQWLENMHVRYLDSPEYACFPFIWLRRKMLDEIGLFDEAIGVTSYGGEDAELCYRAHAAGWKIAVARDVVVQHGDGSKALGEGRGQSWSVSFARRDCEHQNSRPKVLMALPMVH